MNDENLKQAVIVVLSKLITPKLGGDVDYEVVVEDTFVPGTKYVFIDVRVNEDNYWGIYNTGQYNNGEGYNSPSDFDEDIDDDIRTALRYLGVNKAMIDIYLKEV
jgi:hypothetical protein